MATRTASDVRTYAQTLTTGSATGIIKAANVAPFNDVDRTAPVAAVNTPVAGSTLATSTTPLVIDVTDDSTLKRVIIFASFSDGTPAEMVYDGTSFRTAYTAGSARSTISGGYRYSVVRTAGWRSNPNLNVYALDDFSPVYLLTRNEMNFTAFAWVFGADTTAPVMQNPSPANGATLPLSSTSVSVEVVDPGSGVVLSSVTVTITSGGVAEVAYNNSGFQSGFSGSVDTISGGYRFHITRTAGWGTNPSITAGATDTDGHVLALGTTTYSWVFTPAVIASPSGSKFNTGFN